MTKIEFLARELTRMHIMTKKVSAFTPIMYGNHIPEIEMWVDEFWHLFEEEAEDILNRLEMV